MSQPTGVSNLKEVTLERVLMSRKTMNERRVGLNYFSNASLNFDPIVDFKVKSIEPWFANTKTSIQQGEVHVLTL